MNSRPLKCLVLIALFSASAHAADTASLCANAEQIKAVTAHYAQSPGPAFLATRSLAMPEGIILSALPAENAVSAPGSEFVKVWESLQTWDRALTLVLKGGHVFEIYGRIQPGETSKTSKFYNLKYPDAGLGGHLRPDLVATIYAVSLKTKEGLLRGVTFLDAKGDNAFNVFLPESQEPTEAEIAQFEKTRALIASMPRACPAP